MQYGVARNKQNNHYAYYSCSGRTSKHTNCTSRSVPVAVAEQLVAD